MEFNGKLDRYHERMLDEHYDPEEPETEQELPEHEPEEVDL